MNKKYNKLKKRFQDLLAASKVHKVSNQKPVRDWFVLLTGSTVLALILLGVGAYLSFSLLSQAEQELAENVGRLPLNKEHLTQALASFEERANHFEYLREHPEALDTPTPAPAVQVKQEDKVADEEVVEEGE